MQPSVNTEVDLLESLLQPMVAAGHSLRDEDEAEAKEGQSPEEVQNQDLERFLQQLDPDPGLVPDEAPDSDEDHDSLWSSMAEGLPPETLSSEEFQSLVDGFRNTVQDTVEEERTRTLSPLGYHTWMKSDRTLSPLEKVYNLKDYLDGMGSGLDLHHSREETLTAWRWSLSRSTE